ncbi:MAG: hypothetical protein PHD38_07665, partial [Mesotoga sp.]|nr:hypothetical protein [Mesotoga sp.]
YENNLFQAQIPAGEYNYIRASVTALYYISMPLKMKETSGITYISVGLLMRGGEMLGRRKLVFKEEAGLKA